MGSFNATMPITAVDEKGTPQQQQTAEVKYVSSDGGAREKESVAVDVGE